MQKSAWLRAAAPIFVVIAAVVVAIVFISSRKPPEQKEVQTKAFLVDAKPVAPQTVTFEIASQGNVIPKNETRISAQVSGRVVKITDQFVPGGTFKKGDLLAMLEQDDFYTEVKLAEAELAQARAALEEEVARGKVAAQEWKSVNSVVPPELGLRKPQLAKEQANVKAAEAKLERARRNLARTEIRAPYDGLVTNRNIDLGQFVATGTEIGTLYSTNIAEIRLPITDSELGFVNLNESIANQTSVELTAKVAGKTQHWDATLVRTEGVLDAGSRVIYVIAEITDPYQRDSTSDQSILRFGQFVEAVITGRQEKALFVLPRSAIRLDNTVLVVNSKRELEIKPVDIARTTAEHVYISAGLNAGDEVVFSAVPNPYNGMKVRLPGDETDTGNDAPVPADNAISVGEGDNE